MIKFIKIFNLDYCFFRSVNGFSCVGSVFFCFIYFLLNIARIEFYNWIVGLWKVASALGGGSYRDYGLNGGMLTINPLYCSSAEYRLRQSQ